LQPASEQGKKKRDRGYMGYDDGGSSDSSASDQEGNKTGKLLI